MTLTETLQNWYKIAGGVSRGFLTHRDEQDTAATQYVLANNIISLRILPVLRAVVFLQYGVGTLPVVEHADFRLPMPLGSETLYLHMVQYQLTLCQRVSPAFQPTAP